MRREGMNNGQNKDAAKSMKEMLKRGEGELAYIMDKPCSLAATRSYFLHSHTSWPVVNFVPLYCNIYNIIFTTRIF